MEEIFFEYHFLVSPSFGSTKKKSLKTDKTVDHALRLMRRLCEVGESPSLGNLAQPCHHREAARTLIDSVERPQIGTHAYLSGQGGPPQRPLGNCDSPLSSRCDSA